MVEKQLYIPTWEIHTLEQFWKEKCFSVLLKTLFSFSTVWKLLISLSKVQDCVQDVFTDLWIYRDKLSDKVVKAYLLACVRKRITDHKNRIVFLG
jgi:hypothetical protein